MSFLEILGITIAGVVATQDSNERAPDPAAIGLPPGYVIHVVAQGLDAPTGVFLDDDDRVYVVESGEREGAAPRLLRVDAHAKLHEIARGDGDPKRKPWTGGAWSRDAIYVAEGGSPGRILRIHGGRSTVLVDGLPTGDHHTNQPVIGPDGWIYFGQGTVTNTGVMGEDNAQMGWLAENPRAHDVPGQDIVLAGENFECDDPRPGADGDEITTGAFVPLGTQTKAGETIRGDVRCSGAVLRLHPDDGRLELVAWGLRNPFDLAFDAAGRLIATDNGPDRRGSRPVFGAPDCIWAIERGAWYGWPDFFAGIPATNERFESGDQPAFLLAEHPGPVPKPLALMPVHASADGIVIAREPFGYEGQALVALFGDMEPAVGSLIGRVGFMVMRVDLETGQSEPFAANLGDENGPASEIGGGGFERPIDLALDRAGTTLYVLDFGQLDADTLKPVPHTGVLWRVTSAVPAVASTEDRP